MRDDMVLLPGGVFEMGSADFYADERPVHERRVDAFELDRYPVTNADFADFVAETGYLTVAERPLDAAEFPDAVRRRARARLDGVHADERSGGPVELAQLVALAARRVVAPPRRTRHVDRRPAGSPRRARRLSGCRGLRGVGRQATAHRGRARVRLGRRHWGTAFAWGDEPFPGGIPRAHTWNGRFPYDARGPHGGGTAPVGSYPANAFGLFDTIGNVWEWTTDYYTARHLRPDDEPVDPGRRENLLASASSEAGFTTPATGAQGRLAAVLPGVLSALPARRTLAAGGGHGHVAHRLPLRARRRGFGTRRESHAIVTAAPPGRAGVGVAR